MASEKERDDRSILAAEWVLGLLQGRDLERAQTLLRDDAAFANDVDRWSASLEQMFQTWPEVAPPASLERRVLSAAGIAQGNDNAARPWKWATAISSALAASLAVVLLMSEPLPPAPPSQPAPPPAPAMAVAFDVSDGQQVLPGLVDLARHQVRMPRGIEVPQGRVAELWLIEGSAAPKPLGVFKPTANGFAATVNVDRHVPAGATLAISLEPPGGSPTGQPTGPVVATGELHRV